MVQVEIEHGLRACTVVNALAKARGFSFRTGVQNMLLNLIESVSEVFLPTLLSLTSIYNTPAMYMIIVVVVALLFYVHGKHLRSCRDGQLT